MSIPITESAPASTEQSVSLRLRIVLALLASAYVVCFLKANAGTEDVRLAYPRFEPWLWNLFLTCVPVALTGMTGMWWRRDWGQWTFLGAAVVATLIGIYAMGFTLIGVAIVLSFGAVWIAARDDRRTASRPGS